MEKNEYTPTTPQERAALAEAREREARRQKALAAGSVSLRQAGTAVQSRNAPSAAPTASARSGGRRQTRPQKYSPESSPRIRLQKRPGRRQAPRARCGQAVLPHPRAVGIQTNFPPTYIPASKEAINRRNPKNAASPLTGAKSWIRGSARRFWM